MYILLMPQPNVELYNKYLRMKESKNNKTYHNVLINICSNVKSHQSKSNKNGVFMCMCNKTVTVTKLNSRKRHPPPSTMNFQKKGEGFCIFPSLPIFLDKFSLTAQSL